MRSRYRTLDLVVQNMQMDHTLGPDILHNPYHIPIIRSQLTRNIGAVFLDLKDELSMAFDEFIPPSQGEVLRILLPAF